MTDIGGNATVSSNEGPAEENHRQDAAGSVVPHLVGRHVDLALRILDGLGLQVRIVATEVHDKTDRHVVSTRPPAGSLAGDGPVEVVVAVAPVVDDYIGREGDEAIALAERNGHVVEMVVDHRSVAPGTVIDQQPEPGERSRVIILRLADSHTDVGTDSDADGAR